MDYYENPSARSWILNSNTKSAQEIISDHGTIPRLGITPLEFHSCVLPGYTPTPLVRLDDAIARELGVSAVYLKDESSRLGLPAFKILGASWAIFLTLCGRFNLAPGTTTLQDIRDATAKLPDHQLLVLYAATDGNHGRAVARMAALTGCRAYIVVPSGVSDHSRALIGSEPGTTVVHCKGDYDEAVRLAAAEASVHVSPSSSGSGSLLIQDTSWKGYEDIPARIVEGYTTLFAEMDGQLRQEDAPAIPTHIVVPVGVGSLAHAAVQHYRSSAYCATRPAPSIITVEPETAACLLTSLRAAKPTTIQTGHTVMAGLNCGTVSRLAWPDLFAGVDVALAVSDDEAILGVHDLARLGVSSGPCGSAALAAVRKLVQLETENNVFERRFTSDSIVVLISSEGSQTYLEN
jgi:diaminopropionate ammonia-lyase